MAGRVSERQRAGALPGAGSCSGAVSSAEQATSRAAGPGRLLQLSARLASLNPHLRPASRRRRRRVDYARNRRVGTVASGAFRVDSPTLAARQSPSPRPRDVSYLYMAAYWAGRAAASPHFSVM